VQIFFKMLCWCMLYVMQSDMKRQDATNFEATYTHVYILTTYGCKLYIMQSDIRMQIWNMLCWIWKLPKCTCMWVYVWYYYEKWHEKARGWILCTVHCDLNPKWIHATCHVNVKMLFTLKLCAWYHAWIQDVDVMHSYGWRGTYLHDMLMQLWCTY